MDNQSIKKMSENTKRKILNVEYILDNGYDYYQLVIAMIAKFYNCPYQYVVMGKIGFEYLNDKEMKRIGNKLIVYDEKNSKIHWDFLNINKIVYKSLEMNEKLLRQYIDSEMPIIAWSNEHYDLGSNNYKRTNRKYCYIVVGYDKPYFIINDPLLQKKGIYILENQLWKMANLFEILEKIPNKIQSEDIIRELKNDAIFNCSCEKMKNINCFMDDMINFDVSLEFSRVSQQVYQIPLIMKLKKIADQRLAYVALLEFLKKEYICNMQNAIINLREANKKWLYIRYFIIKSYLENSHQIDCQEIGNIIKEIADLEQNAFESILCKSNVNV